MLSRTQTNPPERIVQGGGSLDRVGLRTNVGKTDSMVCRPFQAAGNQSEAAYKRRVTRKSPTYKDRQKVRVSCR